MNTVQLLNALTKNKYTKKYFYGVFPSDKLPKIVPKPCLIIVNNSTSKEKGEHWTCFYMSENSSKNYYFDSFGMKPFMPSYQLFLKTNCKSYMKNVKRLQSSFSSVCGEYCLVFLLSCCKGLSMNAFLNQFSADNFDKNDMKISKLYKQHYKHRQ